MAVIRLDSTKINSSIRYLNDAVKLMEEQESTLSDVERLVSEALRCKQSSLVLEAIKRTKSNLKKSNQIFQNVKNPLNSTLQEARRIDSNSFGFGNGGGGGSW